MIRHATIADLNRLVQLENQNFQTDRIPRRNFRYLLTQANATTLVDEEAGQLRGYAIILYNRAISLARLYSIVIDSHFRGLGLGQTLLQASEQDAQENDCIIIRLEVRRDNPAAINLYRKSGYKQIGILSNYYEDHMEAIHFEKFLVPRLKPDLKRVPYYRQTLDFTCGPAALMMAMKTLRPDFTLSREIELQIWREATMIFMTSGHGGCGPYGLALAAYQRGFDVDLYIKNEQWLFIDSVRNPEKKEVLRFVQQHFHDQLLTLPVRIEYGTLNIGILEKEFEAGHIPVVLISSYRIYRQKSPHWIVVTGFDYRYIYVHDSFLDVEEDESLADNINMPILKKEFERMSRYGKTGQQAALILKNRQS